MTFLAVLVVRHFGEQDLHRVLVDGNALDAYVRLCGNKDVTSPTISMMMIGIITRTPSMIFFIFTP